MIDPMFSSNIMNLDRVHRSGMAQRGEKRRVQDKRMFNWLLLHR